MAIQGLYHTDAGDVHVDPLTLSADGSFRGTMNGQNVYVNQFGNIVPVDESGAHSDHAIGNVGPSLYKPTQGEIYAAQGWNPTGDAYASGASLNPAGTPTSLGRGNGAYAGQTAAAPTAAPSTAGGAGAAAVPSQAAAQTGTQTANAAHAGGNWGTWLDALDNLQAPDLAKDIGGSSSLDWLMQNTGGSRLLSPYYQAMLRSQLPQAQALYQAQNILGGHAATPSESFAQFLVDRLKAEAAGGHGSSGFGTYAENKGTLGSALAALTAGHGGQAFAGDAGGRALTPEETAAAFEFYNDPGQAAARRTLAEGGNVGPYANYWQQRYGQGEAAAAEDANPEGGTWLDAMNNWSGRAW